jgi:hypothetical protein
MCCHSFSSKYLFKVSDCGKIEVFYLPIFIAGSRAFPGLKSRLNACQKKGGRCMKFDLVFCPIHVGAKFNPCKKLHRKMHLTPPRTITPAATFPDLVPTTQGDQKNLSSVVE